MPSPLTVQHCLDKIGGPGRAAKLLSVSGTRIRQIRLEGKFPTQHAYTILELLRSEDIGAVDIPGTYEWLAAQRESA